MRPTKSVDGGIETVILATIGAATSLLYFLLLNILCPYKMKLVAIDTIKFSVLSPAVQVIISIFVAISYFLN